MPYALSNLVDGEKPSFRYIAAPSDAAPGEVVLTDADFLPKQDWLWDTASNALRAPTAADALRLAKRRKEAELRDNSETQISSSTRSFEREVVIYKAATGAPLNAEEQAIRDAMTAQYNSMRGKLAQVKAATTVAGVEAIS